MRKEAKQPLATLEVDQSREGNKVDNARKEENKEEDTDVNFNLPPKFDEYEDEQEEIEKEEKEDLEEKDGDSFEEIAVEAYEDDLLTLDTHHPTRRNEHLT